MILALMVIKFQSRSRFDRKEILHLVRPNKSRFLWGAVQIAAAIAENRTIVVHSGRASSKTTSLMRLDIHSVLHTEGG